MGKKRLDGKIAVISGGASGIGAATARRFVEDGAQVVLGDIDEAGLSSVAGELGEAADAVPLDVRKPEDWEKIFSHAAQRGAVTTLVNSAGISVPGTIEDVELEQFRTIIDINLEGVFLGCKYAVAAMKSGTGGSIVNVASILGVKSSPLFPAYSASKGAVRMLGRSVALHCAEQGYDIRVNTVLPGAIHTAMFEHFIAAGVAAGQPREDVIAAYASVHPMNRMGQADEVANSIAFLASDDASFTTGADLPVEGGYLA